LLAFLRSFQSAGLIFATIAFSVLIAINLIYFGGLTLNLLTLMGLALGFGLIVDNAIVVLENVFRRRQRGEAAHEAAEHGTREVVLPIMASTATTLIVFVPFVYLQGELRVFYVPLAIVVGLTLIASLLVAFTFIPSIAARIMDARRAGLGRARERPPLYARFYSDVVGFTVRYPWPAIVVTLAVFVGSFQLFDRYVSRWAMWGGGFGADTYIRVNIDLPRGSSLERTDELVRYFEDRVEAMPEVERFTAQVMPTRALMEITFPDSLEHTAVPVVIKEQMVAFSHTFTGATVRVYGFGPSFYGGGGSPPNYGIQVLGYNYERVRDIAEDIGTRLSRLSRVVEVDTNASSNRFQRDRASEFTLEIDRDRLARHEITVEEVVQGIGAAAAGNSQLTYVKLGGEEVQVQVKLASNQDLDVLALQETLIPTPSGQRIRLGDVVTIAQREVLAQIRRENQQYERTVAYEFRGPARLGDLVHEAVMAERTCLRATRSRRAGTTGS
jgi:hydrophobic/amphiphilic exporter-1 (mainly G- bacteria), HAE1 family